MGQIKKWILKELDERIYRFLDKNCKIMPKRFCKWIAYFYTDARIRKKYWKRLHVYMGRGTYNNIGMIAINSENTVIKIGKNVSIAPYVTFIAESDANNAKQLKKIPYVRNHLEKAESIIVKDEVWIGANVTILPGIVVGEGAVIGAGSIVTKNLESYCVYSGIPAKKMYHLKKEEQNEE